MPDIRWNQSSRAFLADGGATGALIRAHHWAATPLGPPEGWPQPLKTLVGVMLGSNQPMFVAWGPERTLVYNGPYAEILAGKHPSALGRDFLEVWREIRADLLPIVEQAYAGEPVHMDDIELAMQRRGFPEETHFSFFYAPVRDESGRVAGLYCACTEITAQVLGERRRREAEAALRAERDRTRRVLDGMAEGYALLDRAFRVLDINAEGLRLDTHPREAIVGKTHWEAFPGSEEGELGRLYKRAMAARARVSLDHRYVWEDGRETWLEMRAYPVEDGLALFWRDVTERKRTEAALRENEARLSFLDRLGAETAALADADAVLESTTRLLGEFLNVSVCAYADMDEDQDGFTIRGDWAAPGSQSIVGRYSLADFGRLAVRNLSAGLPLIVNDNLRELAPEEAATFQAIGISATICMPLVREGRLTALMAIHDRAPRVWTEAELSLLREVTARSWAHVERVGAVAELRASEARFRLTADAVPQIVWITDPDGRTEFFNKQWSDYTGAAFEPSTAAGIAASFVHPDDAAPTMAAFEEARRTGGAFLVEHRIRSKTGEYRWFLVRGEPYRDPQSGAITRWFGASVDIHDRRQAEAALRESEERLRELNETLEAQVAARSAERDRLWNLSQDMLARADYSGMMSAVSPAWTEILGWSETELLTRGYATFMHPDDMAPTLDAIGRMAETRRPTRFENRIATRDGGWKPIEWTVAPEPDGVNFIAVGRDLSLAKAREAELQAAQEALRQSQKMEAMGQLTGGVAHDFNNLLTPIIGSLDMIVRKGLGNERERRLIDGALQSAERAKTLVQRLLAFARRQPLQPTAVDLPRLVDGMAGLIDSTLGPTVEIRVDLAPGLPPAKADPNQLEMALLNLAVNARDAMPHGGELTIAAKRESVRTKHSSGLKPGHYVRLSVSDTGSGMDEATRERAVEPFFSTKGVGRGTGLGLSMVHGLAAQLGGGLIIESAPGQGTTVELWLPIHAGPIDSNEGAAAASDKPVGRGAALLVDDEDLVRMSTADMLIDLGFEVIEAGTAEEALHLLRSGARPDLLVTDHLMPGMTGADLAREARVLQSSLPVLLVSGYAEVEGIAPGLPRLTKPFRNTELAASIAALLPASGQ